VSRRFGRALIAAALVLAAGLGALIWWFTDIGPSAAATADRISQARSAGRQIAIDVTSFDYTTLNAQFARVAGETTGQALADQQREESQIRSLLTTEKIKTVGTVNTDAVVPGATSSSVTVLVAVTITQTAAGASPTQSTALIRVGLVRTGTRWVAEAVVGS
jgi:Mce-associated membrane protein